MIGNAIHELKSWADEDVVPFIENNTIKPNWFRTRTNAIKIFWADPFVTCMLLLEIDSPIFGQLVVQTKGVPLHKLSVSIAELRRVKEAINA